MPFSAYRIMWLFAMFDLPVDTKDHRREYIQFRNRLLAFGFTMLQYSVYAKHIPSEEAGDNLRTKIQAALPPHGQVRVLAVTDRQFGKMDVFYGKKRRASESPPIQVSLF
jgi:CRISPR-associated protein Cas2